MYKSNGKRSKGEQWKIALTSVSENVQKKKLSFGTCLKKQFVRKKTKVFFKHAPRNNEMKGFIL